MSRERVPLCIRVYDALLREIRNGQMRPGRRLPGELSMAARFEVSRTVVREALLLLEEDGYLVRAQGRRWTAAVPRIDAIAFSDPLPRLLGTDAAELRADRVGERVARADAFTAMLFGEQGPVIIWETLYTKREGGPVASALEFVPVRKAPSALLTHSESSSTTLLGTFESRRRARMKPVLWRIAPVSRDSERVRQMSLRRSAVPIVLTVALAENGAAAYAGKHILDLTYAPLTVDVLPPAPADAPFTEHLTRTEEI